MKLHDVEAWKLKLLHHKLLENSLYTFCQASSPAINRQVCLILLALLASPSLDRLEGLFCASYRGGKLM